MSNHDSAKGYHQNQNKWYFHKSNSLCYDAKWVFLFWGFLSSWHMHIYTRCKQTAFNIVNAAESHWDALHRAVKGMRLPYAQSQQIGKQRQVGEWPGKHWLYPLRNPLSPDTWNSHENHEELSHNRNALCRKCHYEVADSMRVHTVDLTVPAVGGAPTW